MYNPDLHPLFSACIEDHLKFLLQATGALFCRIRRHSHLRRGTACYHFTILSLVHPPSWGASVICRTVLSSFLSYIFSDSSAVFLLLSASPSISHQALLTPDYFHELIEDRLEILPSSCLLLQWLTCSIRRRNHMSQNLQRNRIHKIRTRLVPPLPLLTRIPFPTNLNPERHVLDPEQKKRKISSLLHPKVLTRSSDWSPQL